MGVQEIRIYSADGKLKTAVIPSDSSVYSAELMASEYVRVLFNLHSPVIFAIGDYIKMPNLGFEIFELTTIQRPSYNATSGVWKYDLQFDASYYRLKNRLFCYDRQNGDECSFSLTHNIEHHAAIVKSNIDALGFKKGNQAITIAFDDSINQVTMKAITYTNQSVIDAIAAISEAFACEWWFDGATLNFGRCETAGDYVKFSEGEEVNGMSSNDSSQDYCTRIIAFGGERNITSKYRGGDEQVTNHIAKKRLMLPADTPYVDVFDGITDAEVVEKVLVFDDIYPRRVGQISTVEKKEYSDKNEQTGEVTKWNAFRFTDAGISFSKDYILAGETLKIIFQSGVLNGMIFDVSFNPNGDREKNADGTINGNAQVFEIIRNDDYGVNLPADDFAPAVGDKYVLYNFDSSKLADIQIEYGGENMGLIEAAEKELYDAAVKQAAKLKIDGKQYQCPMNMVRYYGYADSDSGLQYTQGTELEYGIGQRVELVNSAYFTQGRKSRIYAVERALNGRSCTYTVAESSNYSRFNALEKDIEAQNKNISSAAGGGSALDGGKYLKRGGDSSDGVYDLQEVKTSQVMSRNLENGAGFALYDVDPRLTLVSTGVKSIDFVPRTKSIHFSDNDSGEETLTYNNAFTFTNSGEFVSVRFLAGFIKGGTWGSQCLAGVKVYCKTVLSLTPATQSVQAIDGADGDGTVDTGGSEVETPGTGEVVTPGGGAADSEWRELGMDGDSFVMPVSKGTATYSIKAVFTYTYRKPSGEASADASLQLYLKGNVGDGTKTEYQGDSVMRCEADVEALSVTKNKSGWSYGVDGVARIVDGSEYGTFFGAYHFSAPIDFTPVDYELPSTDVAQMRHLVQTLIDCNTANKVLRPVEAVFGSSILSDTPDGLISGVFSVRSTACYIDTDMGYLHFIFCVCGKNYHMYTEKAVSATDTSFTFKLKQF